MPKHIKKAAIAAFFMPYIEIPHFSYYCRDLLQPYFFLTIVSGAFSELCMIGDELTRDFVFSNL